MEPTATSSRSPDVARDVARPASLREQLNSARARARESARLLGLAIGLAWSAAPGLLLGLVALAGVRAALPLAQLALTRELLTQIGGRSSASGISDWTVLPISGLHATIFLAALAVAASRLIHPLSVACETLAGDRLTGYVTGRVIRAANSWRGLARFEDPALADDLRVVRNVAYRAGLAITRDGTFAATELCAALALAAMLAALHPLAALIVVATSAPHMLQQWEHWSRTSNSIYVRTPETRRLGYFRHVALESEPAPDIRLYDLAPFFRHRYDGLFERTTRAFRTLQIELSNRSSLGASLAALGAGAVYLWVVWEAAAGRLGAGDVVLYGGAAVLLHAALLDVAIVTGVLPREIGFLPALDRVLNAPPDLPVPSRPLPAPTRLRKGIVFDDVWFAYPGMAAQRAVLRGVSFALRSGESVALVGQNGAGKTTIVKLLLRLYDPTHGCVMLDGANLREYDVDAVRRRMGAIFQDFVRYDLTARQNIALGDLTALRDDARVLAAARKAGAGALLDSFRDGLDTRLGWRFGGRDLSGGEWQKIALARAFVRECDVLALDEPTAALDVQTEHDVYRRFHELTRGKATLLISHRFSTVRMADRILFLADGRIAEEGTHEDLIARGGEYARLYELQASQYAAPSGQAAEMGPRG